MSDDQPAPSPPVEEKLEPPAAVLSARGTVRVVLALLAVWTIFSGLALTFFQDASAATIGGGLDGGEGGAAQRLLGVHLLVLAPIYALIAWEPQRFRLLLWVPYAAQAGVVLVTLYDILTGDRDFTDGALPLIVASIFLVLLVYVWRAGRLPESASSAVAELSPPETEGELGSG
ncbi:MAG: hypothetical protein WBD55_10705 [Dehalococcoidia bacterium]